MAYKRIVVKIGTNLLTDKLCGLKVEQIQDIARQISVLKSKGIEVLIVTSGAIGAGCTELGVKKSREVETRQALAAVGQSTVMRAYHDAFSRYKAKVGQILLTYEDFSNRTRYLHLKKAIERLLDFGVIPIINENDPISVDEIGATFGDNDKLSALVASKVNADLLIIVSDIDGLYDKNPKLSKDAKLIRRVESITKDIENMAGKAGSAFSVGGMESKVKAAKIVMDFGCDMIICNGKKKDILQKALEGKEGTLFVAANKLNGKQRWIKFAKEKGKIRVNDRAKDILLDGKSSLLAVGVVGVEGEFDKGEVVLINDFAKGISDHSSKELANINGKKGKVVIKRGNIVIL
ncbi:MAG TPA: glutamate 5-kinase [Candidatus Nanoarchaeia archaeon]|nr:glutamate 5-kinase [Candidatus Nanoarchaeia archaeon]